MELIWTEKALNEREKRLAKSSEKKGSYYKLQYDTEGCGCVNDGVTYLTLTDKLRDGDHEVTTNAEPVYIESRFAVYLNEKMSIDFSDAAKSFQLKSPEQMINPRMVFKFN